MRITDEMIERACAAHWAHWNKPHISEKRKEWARQKMRAALATLQARVAELEVDARRWRKCKRMRKSWWLAALTEAGMMHGRSLDEQIDEQPDAPVDFME